MRRLHAPRASTAVLLAAAVSAAAAPAPSFAAMASPAVQMGALLRQAFAKDAPGAAAIVVKDGRVVFREAQGMASLELGVPLRPDMVFRLGSITKQFTAVAVVMLAQDGKLSLQDPIDKYLPGYPMQGHLITVEHLLTHTSGIQSYTDMPGWMQTRILGDMKVEELIDGFKREPMQFAPGTQYRYNNSAYVLLGAIIEKASGTSYAAFLEERIFKPLGMKSASYGSNGPIIPGRAAGYTLDEGGPKNALYLSMTQPYSAGALVASVDDLAAWDAALYTERLLPRSWLDKMWTPYQLADGKSTNYGYGWAISELRGRPTLEHGGGIFGFSTYGLRVPGDRVYVAVLCNSDSPAVAPGFLAKKLAAIAVGDPFPERVATRVDPELLQRYVGVYQIEPGVTRTVTLENGQLFTQRSGGRRQPALPASETEFFYERSFSHFRFVLDARGRATEMLMHQDGAAEPERAARIADEVVERQPARLDPALYDAYVGEYELAPGFILTVTREGDRLMTQATGQEKVEIFPASETEFFLKVVDAQISFVKGPDGRVDRLILHQGGRDVPGTRRK